ncbi:MAG: O-antigen ligase family protein [bacterium]|nr:O-antigen ligase family protein [bacterium]
MKKFFNFFDDHILKIGIAFLLVFIPLYPKLPLLDIRNTWVYIRIEDFLVLTLVFIWFVQLLRKKVSLWSPLSAPIFIYWIIGGISLLYSLIFLAPHLANFFPSVAVLHYFRRIEYMIPAFIAVSTIKSLRDVKHYAIIIALTLLGVTFYGFGQRYLGFPAYLTMNEEFSKGIPLYLPPTARLTSTFAGHYDLAIFLVFTIVFVGSLIFGFRNKLAKFGLFILGFFALVLLLFTASRISFSVYLLAISLMLYLQKKRWLIVPVIIGSLVLMSVVSGASERFAKTFRIQKVVYNSKTGEPIAVLEETPPTPEGETEPTPPPEENLPLGSGFLPVPSLDKNTEATTVATIRRSVIASLKTASSSSEIATISGEFLIRRTIVYDISFTTRFQGEWPRALEAFRRNPVLGSGYSSISLATDNDYLRALGETGVMGFLSFLSILGVAVLVLRRAFKFAATPFEKSILIGVGAGLFGLLLNATLIDVFEASKVAFTFWMILGITVGMASLGKKPTSSLFQEAIDVVKLPVTAFFVFFILLVIVFNKTLTSYFTGDDFTWLYWASTTAKGDVLSFFLWADGFFYRPLAKTYFTLVHSFFGLKPQAYHVVDLLLHYGLTVAVYFLAFTVSKKKLVAFLAGLFFLLNPFNAESILWIASTSAAFAIFFYFWSALLYFWWRQNAYFWRPFSYVVSIAFFALGIFSHEVALTLPLLLVFYDLIFVSSPKGRLLKFLPLLPYFLIIDAYLWLRVGAGAHGLTGDYGYNLKNVGFNVLVNFWGYLGGLLAGLGFLICLAAFLMIFLSRKHNFKKLFGGANFKVFLFAFVWFFIGLIPFLGLGNIAERHVYLASFGFMLALALFVSLIWEKIRKINATFGLGVLLILIFGLTGFYWWGMIRAQKNWEKAGETANRILLTLSSNYASFPPQTTLYFVNLPLRYERAWIFPEGLKDGLWFIYQDKNLKLDNAPGIEEALDLSEKNMPSHVFVFEDGELKEAKRE